MNDLEADRVLEEADLLHSEAEIEAALDSMAMLINDRLSGTDPIVFCVMNGGLIPAGRLLPRLTFPFRLDYLHATRYREKTTGNELKWLKSNEICISGKEVLVIDDILDEGYTLEAIVEHCMQQGARRVYTAVLAEKKHSRGNHFEADFIGLEIKDRYVFGMGMDYKGYLRQLPAIYAVKGL
jgi:hypoxanthine phosphoribosyltransferase